MSNISLIAWTVVVVAVMLALAHRWQLPNRTPLTLSLARGLRRWARALWCLSEGIEVGFHHGQRTKQQISLELEAQ
jgi:hypothetical protein